MDFNRYNAESAWELISNPQPDVLVVGANTGKDCSYFVEFGAKSIVGLDVIDAIGSEYQHPIVRYAKESAEAMSFPDNSFDLVYCYATMEHVPNVAAAFSEMARVVRPGGFIYCLASPLWHSPIGHHMGEFQSSPWIHLIRTPAEILEFAIAHDLYPGNLKLAQGKVEYMLTPDYFNMRPAADYLQACRRLAGLRFIHNEVLNEDAELLKHPNGVEAMAKGFPPSELLGVTHRLMAQKRIRNDLFSVSKERAADSMSRLMKRLRQIKRSFR